MTPTPTPVNFTLATDPMLANVGEPTKEKFELVFIYGYIGKVTDDTVVLHQGLDLRKYYEIPRCEIVYAVPPNCPGGPGTMIVLFSTTCITYVSGSATAMLPASSLAAVVSANNAKARGIPVPGGVCPAGCMCNGICTCASYDYWLNLDEATAKKLGVVVSSAPSGNK
jgi:hypothetical protein